ncbi:Glutamyl-tRNA(Gln) amidotransferase subunit D [uncultured archaeon]|nr:Glutamyl-tRNA(Gln) amidotransferase subunit D [uncultured archaeon]
MSDKPLPGDKVKIVTPDGVVEGVWMERPELLSSDFITLKLSSGYNMGVDRKRILSMDVVSRHVPTSPPRRESIKTSNKLPTVAVLSTGGTISSRVDYQTGGVSAAVTAEDLVAAVPEISEHANLSAKAVMNVMSEDMTPKKWVQMADAVVDALSDSDGVIVTHGTDTMHFSTAALSFLLSGLGKPVVFTGSQRSSDRGSSDSFLNLFCSAVFAGGPIAGVSLVMHENMTDGACLAHRGVNVRKMHTSRRDAFQSINDAPLARITIDGKIHVLNGKHKVRDNSLPDVKGGFEEKVGLLKVYPGMPADAIDYFVDKGYRGIVIEGTALGHVPTNSENNIIPGIERAVESGMLLAMTTQCLYGRVHPHVYSNLRKLSSMGVVYCENMLSEVAYVKLMWVLSQVGDVKAASNMLVSPVAGEITARTEP